MIPLRTGLAFLLAATVLATGPAFAGDVRAKLTPELIWQHCTVNGVGSEVEGVWMLPSGERVSGTILCTEADLVKPAGAGMHRGDDDDEGEEHEGGEGDED